MDKQYYKNLFFFSDDVTLQSLSREITGNPDDPTHSTLLSWSSRNEGSSTTWTEDRRRFRETQTSIINGGVQKASAVRLSEVLADAMPSRYSPYVSEAIALSLKRTLEDPNFLSLQDEIALVDARNAELLQQLNTLGASQAWSLLAKLVNDLELAQGSGDSRAVAKISLELVRTIREGDRKFSLWDDVFRNIDQRARLINVESQRQARGDRSVPIESLMLFLEALKTRLHQRAVVEGLAGMKLLKAVKSDLADLTGNIGQAKNT